MHSGLPKDPVMLLSVINTKLRDYYKSFDLLCEEEDLSKFDIIKTLESIDYEYDAGRNQFV